MKLAEVNMEKGLFFLIIFICLNSVRNDEAFVAQDDYYMHPIPKHDDKMQDRKMINPDELEIDYWMNNAQNYLKNKVKARSFETPKKAKNIIFFLGDGMSLTTVAATRMYLGGEDKSLSFEEFPHFGLSKTYCVDRQVADSACTATAYLTGVKANYGTMGLNAKIMRGDCTGQNNVTAHTESIAKWAQDQDMSTGFVTTSRVTHASPGGLYAHIADRDWENDQEVRQRLCDPDETIDIARQLIEGDVGEKFKVIMGGGRREFRDRGVQDEEGSAGSRNDGRDLVKTWITNRKQNGRAAYVFDKQGLNNVNINETDYLLGLFQDDHCLYNLDIENQGLTNQKPSLSEMTKAAIQLLQKDKKGYFLFVEGARIDMAHHENFARIALDETKEFSKTIAMARKMTSMDDTLLVVTSDHSHTMTYNGYPKRGNDILGLSGDKGDDDLPYSTLSYANGKGYYQTYEESGPRKDLTGVDFSNPRLRYIATAPLPDETHGGDDVGIYASGPQSQIFVGNYEQSNIPMLMAYAARVGPYAEANIGQGNSAITLNTSSMSILCLIISNVFLVITNI